MIRSYDFYSFVRGLPDVVLCESTQDLTLRGRVRKRKIKHAKNVFEPEAA